MQPDNTLSDARNVLSALMHDAGTIDTGMMVLDSTTVRPPEVEQVTRGNLVELVSMDFAVVFRAIVYRGSLCNFSARHGKQRLRPELLDIGAKIRTPDFSLALLRTTLGSQLPAEIRLSIGAVNSSLSEAYAFWHGDMIQGIEEEAALFWSRLAETALDLHRALEAHRDFDAPEACVNYERPLAQVALGGWPYLKDDGELNTAVMFERREGRRHPVSIACTVSTETGTVKATLVNVSRSGLGIALNSGGLLEGLVTVGVGRAFRFECTVMWQTAARAGLKIENGNATVSELWDYDRRQA